MACEASHTGRALREYAVERDRVVADGRASFASPATVAEAPRVADAARNAIVVHRAREHNLRDVDVSIPRDGMTVVTGVSGSGKSTLAFDIVFAEGQRRYLESLNAYARQFVQPAGRPDVDAIFGIPPTVAIEQRTSRGGRKSTVGTLTEVHHFLRLLYVKLGLQHCPECEVPIEPQTADAIAARLLREAKGRRIELLAPLIVARKGYYTDLAKWAAAKGYAQLRVDGDVPAHREVATARPLPRAHDRAARGRSDRRCEERTRAAATAAAGARLRQGRRARARPRQAAGVLDPARLPVLWPQLRRARSALVLLQLEARLVRVLLRHRRRDQGLRRGADRRGDLVERLVRGRGHALWRLRRTAPESSRAERALPQPVDRRARGAAGGRRPQVLRRPQAGRARARDRARPAGGDPLAARIPAGRRPRLHLARSRGADALGRRGAAHPPGRAARLEPAGRLLRARRADDRPAPARQRGAARHAGEARRQGQHAARRRARRGHDPPRRPRDRPRSRCRHARRPRRRRGAHRRPDRRARNR